MKSKIALIVSAAFNIVLFVMLSITRFETSFSYDSSDFEKIAAANIVTSPQGSVVVFNPVEITLEPGQSASVQFSVMLSRKQLNWMAETLYDRGVVQVKKNPFGITILAVGEGTAALQTVTENGIKDVAHVTVAKKSDD
jgi:hypothetical protein